MKPYPSYNDSGVEWIGEIPSGWNIYPLKYGVIMVTEKIPSKPEDIKISPENVESNTGVCFNLYSDYSGEGVSFFSGDILLNKLRLYLKKIVFTEYDGLSMGEMIVLRTQDNIFNKYLFYILFNQGLIDLLDSQSNGVKLPRVSPEVILNTSFLYPPLQEQQQISNYLDHNTRQIDTLIENTQQKIELLKEQRTSLINRVVTKGLNPNVEMKDSGVEWIGDIPSGCKISRIGYESSVIDPQPDHRAPKMDENGYPYIGIRDIDQNGKVNVESCRFVELEAIIKQEESYTIGSNDLIFCKVGTLGFSRFFQKPETRFAISATLVIIKVNSNNDPRFINYFLKSNYIENIISYESTGSTRKSLGIQIIRDFKVIIHKKNIQNQISNYLDKETTKIDTLIEKENQRIDLLKEYRQSLISEVVTGKVDVRDEVFV
jgi:type I restriction enzyme, S subunit